MGTEWTLLKPERQRRYLPGWTLVPLRPLFRYSAARDAYVLRLVGNRRGPVLRRDRRSERRGRGSTRTVTQ
jgi:hypothetical protein